MDIEGRQQRRLEGVRVVVVMEMLGMLWLLEMLEMLGEAVEGRGCCGLGVQVRVEAVRRRLW